MESEQCHFAVVQGVACLFFCCGLPYLICVKENSIVQTLYKQLVMPALQCWPTELTLQLYVANQQETRFNFVIPELHSLPTQLCQTSCDCCGRGQQKYSYLKKKSIFFMLLFPAYVEHSAVVLVQVTALWKRLQ